MEESTSSFSSGDYGGRDMIFASLEDIDEMIKKELDNVGYRDVVNTKMAEMNTGIDRIVKPIMDETRGVFDQILESVNRLEAEERLLASDIHQLIDSDVIVLDDDDEETPETTPSKTTVTSPPKASKVSEKSSDCGQVSTDIVKTEDMSADTTSNSIGLRLGMRVLAKKRTQWFPATIIDMTKQDEKTKYKVRYDMNRGKSKVQANHLACLDTCRRFGPGQIPAGSRIAADLKAEGIYSGVVAEAPDRKMNKNRFLVFFDDGCATYCNPSCVYLVYGPPANVWDDISHRQTADYVQEYLSTPERPMLTMKVNQILKVEFQGEWHRARCVKVDCSLVEVVYLIDNSREWIYRGSLRLEPLFKESHRKIKAMQNKTPRRLARAHTGVRKAHIEYTTIDLTRDSSPSPSNSPNRSMTGKNDGDDRKKNVGKKSTGGISKQQSMFESGASRTNISPTYRRSEGEWKAPWSMSLAAQKPEVGYSPVTRLPQSYSELKGGVDVASHILDRISNQSKQVLPKKGWKTGFGGREKRSKSTEEGKVRHLGQGDGVDRNSMKMEMSRNRMLVGARSQNYNLYASKRSAYYNKHICSQKCVEPFLVADITRLKGVNPLIKPLLLGWTREVARIQSCTKGSPFHVYYRAPCGRMCRNMSDVDRYMLETYLNDLDYDQFCFDHSVRTQSNTVIRPRDAKFFMEDYADGREDLPISCVNEINYDRPPVMPYTKKRIPGENVHINTSTDFMVCCDCPDNCRNRSSCPCQQLTVSATSCSRGSKIKEDAGYSYKRLYGFLPTGIYECNSKCKCNMNCSNRVVQKGLQCRLQMFKTQKKGWGIRCLDDIARGTFVCVYTGKIQTEDKANEEGLANGDEYLAELDHIEVAERQKEVEDDGASSSGIDSDMDAEEDMEELKRDGHEKVDRQSGYESGPNTTDSDAENVVTKHVTVTLKRDLDSKWTVKGNGADGSFYELKSGDAYDQGGGKESQGADGKQAQGKPSDRQNQDLLSSSTHRKLQRMKLGNDREDTFDSDGEVASAFDSSLAPPIRPNGDDDVDDDDTTDTDSEYSANGNSRPSSACGTVSSSKHHSERRPGTQSIGLHSSKSGSNKLTESSDDEEEAGRTRRCFGNSDIFVIDAKQTGNLGRYLNHSCMPNLLVQNVFIDTHDLRFPWVAFFATSTIRAGTELTWDYNYEIGSVEGREMPCYCGATKCRKRLL